MSSIALLVVALLATTLLVAGVRLVMTRALENDHSFRTDLEGPARVALPRAAGGPR